MQNKTMAQTSVIGAKSLASLRKPAALFAALAVGMVMLYAVGFVETSAVHTVAHDMRHAMGFPCH